MESDESNMEQAGMDAAPVPPAAPPVVPPVPSYSPPPPAPGYAPPAPGYAPPPAPGYPAAPRSTNSGLATAGMILGIAGLLFCWVPWIGFPCAALALIFGIVALNQAKTRPVGNKGMAKAALIMGIVGLVLSVLIVVIVIIIAAVAASSQNSGLLFNGILMAGRAALPLL